MSLEFLLRSLEASIAELSKHLQDGPSTQRLGLRRAARLPVAAALHARLRRPVLLLTDRADHALSLAEELAMWAPGTPRPACGLADTPWLGETPTR